MSWDPSKDDPRWRECDEWANAHLMPSDNSPLGEALKHAIDNSNKSGLPDIAVSPAHGRFLQLQAKLINAKNILEVGALGGYSTVWMASASPDVHVTTVEIDAEMVRVSRENIAFAGLSDRVKVIHDSGLNGLAKLQKEVESGSQQKFQMVFIDADKINNLAYFKMAKSMCSKGACIIVDNVGRSASLADDEIAKTSEGVQGARMVIEGIGKMWQQATMIQTVGSKGCDGFLMVIVE